MTREEAIKHLETYSTTNGSGQTTQAQHEEAKQMAIKALEQEPCEDAISRQAVIELAYDMSEIDGEHFAEPCMVVDLEDIRHLPSVTQEPKTGHWIKKEDDTCWWYVCSECEQEPLKKQMER